MNTITVTIPENLNDLTLDQMQRLEVIADEEDFDVRARAICSTVYKMSGREVELAPRADIKYLVEAVDKVLAEASPFTMRFNFAGTDWGFIPNLEKITTAEWVDLETLGFETGSLHKIMAILYRPVAEQRGEKYSIVPYHPEAVNFDLMKDMPAGVAKGAILFFCRLGLACMNGILKLQKATPTPISLGKDLVRNGAGMPAL